MILKSQKNLHSQLKKDYEKTTLNLEQDLFMTGLHRNWKVHPKDALNIENALMPEDIADTVMYLLSLKPHVRIPKLLILPKDHAI